MTWRRLTASRLPTPASAPSSRPVAWLYLGAGMSYAGGRRPLGLDEPSGTDTEESGPAGADDDDQRAPVMPRPMRCSSSCSRRDDAKGAVFLAELRRTEPTFR